VFWSCNKPLEKFDHRTFTRRAISAGWVIGSGGCFQVALKNCKKRGDGEEMKQVGFAINVAILLSRRTNTNIEVGQ